MPERLHLPIFVSQDRTYILGGDDGETITDNLAMKRVHGLASGRPFGREVRPRPASATTMLLVAAITIGGGILAIFNPFNLSQALRALIG